MPVPLTILAQCSDRLFQAERDASGQLRVQQTRLQAEATPETIVPRARQALGRLRGRVFVLCEAIHPVILTLDEQAVQGLATEELGGALAFEAQAFTSLEPEAAAVAWTRCDTGGTPAFWTASLPIAQRDAWQTALETQGCVCAGLAHPAGVPRALLPGQAAWRRVERWRDLVAVVAAGASGWSVAMQRTDARRWLDDGVATEHLAGPGMVEYDARPIISLDDDAGVTQWLGAWMEALDTPVPAVPVIRPPQRPVPTTRIVALAVALGFLAAVALWLARGAIESRKDETLRSLGARQRPVQELADLRKRIAELKPKADAVAAERERVREQQRVGLERRRRCLHALASVGAVCPPGTVVDELAVTCDGGRIAGRCIAQEAAARLASDLSVALAKAGLVATPADTRVDGRLRRFVIQWAMPRDLRSSEERP